LTRRLRLRQFRAEDAEAMHECFADPETMRFWNHPLHTTRIETERFVRRFMDCTPSYYRVWAAADAESDRCLALVNYHDGHIRSKRVAIGYMNNPARHRQGSAKRRTPRCSTSASTNSVYNVCRPSSILTTKRRVRWSRNLGSAAKGCCCDNLRVGDVWRDDVLYALLESDRRAPLIPSTLSRNPRVKPAEERGRPPGRP
jgi:[ribosomal protein S5]-alanine N-acetyltransferase